MVVFPYVLQASQGHPLATATLCVGTNVGPGSRPLRFAEKDAVDVAHLVSGHAGVQGRGAIDVRCARGVCDVYTRVGGRQGLPTAIQVDVCNAHGYRIAGGGQFVPTSNDHPERGSYRLPFDVVLGDETTHYYLQSTSRAPLSVRVSVSDLRGRVLGQVQRSLLVQRATP